MQLSSVGGDIKHVMMLLTEILCVYSVLFWNAEPEPALLYRPEETMLNPVLQTQHDEAVPESAQENHQEDTEEIGGRDMESPESSEEDNAPILPENEMTM